MGMVIDYHAHGKGLPDITMPLVIGHGNNYHARGNCLPNLTQPVVIAYHGHGSYHGHGNYYHAHGNGLPWAW